MKHLIFCVVYYKIEQVFCVAYYKIEQDVGVGLVVGVVGWSSLTIFLFKAKVLTDGLGLIGLIYKLSKAQFQFQFKISKCRG